jgi:hypothetical protein
VRRADPVQGEPPHHDDEPAPQVPDLGDLLRREAGEGVLHHVLCLGAVGQYPVPDGDQVGPVVVRGGGHSFGRHSSGRLRFGLAVSAHAHRTILPPVV